MDKNEETAKMIKNLIVDEEVENALISMYLEFLDLGLKNCVIAEKRENFHRDIEMIYDDSIKHKAIIEKMIYKYRKN